MNVMRLNFKYLQDCYVHIKLWFIKLHRGYVFSLSSNYISRILLIIYRC
jgi:hypothetical protein